MSAQIYYRVVKAGKKHPFAGLYAVEKLVIKAGAIVEKEIVKEWDLRILSEAALARFGGSSAFEAYKADNGEPEDMTGIPSAEEVKARTEEDLKHLTKRKLSNELRLK